jgi:hypothetical protein
MRFSELISDTKWISPRLNNGDWDYWLVIELMDWYDTVGKNESPAHYHVNLSVVVPSQAPALTMAQLVKDLPDSLCDNIHAIVEALHSYGLGAPIWQENGNKSKALLTACKRFANMEASLLFGFIMYRPINAVGATEWDWIKGRTMPEDDIPWEIK